MPGTVAGLALAEQKYGSGKFTLADLIMPAISLAREGIAIADDTADSLPSDRARLARWPSSAQIFLKPDGNALGPGDRLVQPDLADTLLAIAQEGPQAFYEGAIAQKIAAAVQAAGGVMTADDLQGYRAVERAPVRGTYRGYDIVSMPPPSSGGVALIEMLNILEGYDLAHDEQTEALFLITEAMKRAYADRAYFLGDPDAVKVPVARLISKSYAAEWRATIDPAHATPAKDIHPTAAPLPKEGRNTTHFSVIDHLGNAVSNTYTLNFSYGVGLVAAGTGIVLNNELDDFAAKPDAPNAYGLLGFEANAPGPGKRPLSSMTPTIVLKDGKPYLDHRLAGRQPDHQHRVAGRHRCDRSRHGHRDAVSAPRVHDQWMPDRVFAEPGFSAISSPRSKRAATASSCGGCRRRPIRSWSRPRLCRRRRPAHARGAREHGDNLRLPEIRVRGGARQPIGTLFSHGDPSVCRSRDRVHDSRHAAGCAPGS